MEESRGPAQLKRANAQGPDPLIGRVINDRYRVLATIARGGMGKVYRAEQQPLGRAVALKVLSPNYTGDNDPEFHKRFFLEASTASKLSHPNTVTIFDYGKTEDEIYYIAMELLEGRTLHRALREEGPFTAERTMHIGRQICRSLREAHNLGVVHRDLKPANVYLLDHGDEADVVKVLDFGLVKNLLDKGEELTQAGLFMGSPKYMSPEQIRGDECDGRVDIYALGVIMYEMLTGKVPFDRQNSVNILMAHIHEEVPPTSAVNPQVRVPPALENLVRKCMAKSADARYPSMEALLSALKQVSGMATTMSGEFRAPNFADLSGSTELPLQTSITTRGELLSGGKGSITEIDTRTRVQFAAFGQGGQGEASALTPIELPVVAATSAPRRWGSPRALAALAAVLVVGGVAYIASQRFEHTSQTVTRTAGRESSAVQAQLPVSEAIRAAPVPPQDTLQTAVLVSLKSTPSGAMVAVGDKEYGPTPTQVEWAGAEAAIGREVTFRFQRRGFRDVTVTRQIRGAHLDIEAPLLDPVVQSVKPAVRTPRTQPAVRAVNPPSEHSTPPGDAPPSTTPPPVLTGFKAEPY